MNENEGELERRWLVSRWRWRDFLDEKCRIEVFLLKKKFQTVNKGKHQSRDEMQPGLLSSLSNILKRQGKMKEFHIPAQSSSKSNGRRKMKGKSKKMEKENEDDRKRNWWGKSFPKLWKKWWKLESNKREIRKFTCSITGNTFWKEKIDDSKMLHPETRSELVTSLFKKFRRNWKWSSDKSRVWIWKNDGIQSENVSEWN